MNTHQPPKDKPVLNDAVIELARILLEFEIECQRRAAAGENDTEPRPETASKAHPRKAKGKDTTSQEFKMLTIPTPHQDLIEGPIVVTLVTLMPDGQPQATAVWLLYDGTHFLVVTGCDRQKYRNMRRNPLVTIMALDPKNSGRYVEIRGRVVEIDEEGATPVLDKMAQLYEGTPKYYGYVEPAEDEGKQPLALCKIRPTKIVTAG